MLEVTDAARNELKNYFSNNDIAPVRIYLAPGGCTGPRLALALDEIKETDETFDQGDDITFVVDKKLAQEAKPIKIDVSEQGFTVESALPLGGGSCGDGCCGSCSCS